ncbi:MAG: cation:proton antiporter [Bacteroidaceae bacterium]|nr:cation:proton antiporter [Prevotella sp.]MBR3615607.1 cation:proton antiporter [Bacteroidaceae bacterium]
MMNFSSIFPVSEPTWIFLGVLCIVLFAPLIFNKLRMPHIIGMILAGLLIGPKGLNIIERDDSFELFGNVGLYYIMFLASLEINMQEMKQAKGGALLMGLAVFLIPIALGMLSNMFILEYGLMASLLLASMYASYTLISYPVVARYGLSRLRCVNFVVGGTIITDTLTLFVLAVVAGIFTGEASVWLVIWMLVKLLAIVGLIVFAFPRIARYFFRTYNDSVIQYIFVLAMLFLGAGLMELAGMEGILGAFITGLVLNRLIPHSSPLMRRIDFVGNAIFIPYFLIGVGMMIDITVLFNGGGSLLVAVVMVTTALVGKWLASFLVSKAYKMSTGEQYLMFGLSTSQAAATLAAAIVGHEIGLLNEDVLNGTILLILVTCIVSSIVSDRASRRLVVSKDLLARPAALDSKKTLLALANPTAVDKLMDLALLVRKENSQIPLSAITVVLDEDKKLRRERTKVLDLAAEIAASVNIPLLTKMRLTTNLAHGIIHEVKENDYRELIVGFHQKETANDSFLGGVLPEVLNALDCQVVMARMNIPLNTIRTIHITFPAKAEYEAGFSYWVEETARMASGLDCKIMYHGHPDTMSKIQQMLNNYDPIDAQFFETDGGNDLKRLASIIHDDHLLIIVSARRGSISFRPSHDHIFVQLQRDYQNTSVLLIYPGAYKVEGGETH